MRTRSQKRPHSPDTDEAPAEPNPPPVTVQNQGDEGQNAAEEKPCSSRSISANEQPRAAPLDVEMIDSPCSSGASSGVICISDSEDKDVLKRRRRGLSPDNPVCVDLTETTVMTTPPAERLGRRPTLLNNTVIAIDDSDDEVAPVEVPARSIRDQPATSNAARNNAPEPNRRPTADREN